MIVGDSYFMSYYSKDAGNDFRVFGARPNTSYYVCDYWSAIWPFSESA